MSNSFMVLFTDNVFHERQCFILGIVGKQDFSSLKKRAVTFFSLNMPGKKVLSPMSNKNKIESGLNVASNLFLAFSYYVSNAISFFSFLFFPFLLNIYVEMLNGYFEGKIKYCTLKITQTPAVSLHPLSCDYS